MKIKKPGVIFCCALAVCSFCMSSVAGESRSIEESAYSMYVPSGIDASRRYPLVIVFSPSGDSRGMIEVWKNTAEQYKWIVLASKEVRDGKEVEPILRTLVDDVQKVCLQLPVDKSKIVASGFSGGGMCSHIFSFLYPDIISAVIINTGMIQEAYIQRRQYYPRGKYAVFLASPKDFRYEEMKRDDRFLKTLGWKTKWIEFEDGHTIAPEQFYEQAAQWLDQELNNVRKPVRNTDKIRAFF